jgi:hypothetical protein
MTQDLLGGSILRDISKIDCAAGSTDHGVHVHRRARAHWHLHLSAHLAVPGSRGLGRKELRSSIGRGRDNCLIPSRRHGLLHRARHTVLLVSLLRLLISGHVLELAVSKSGRGTGLEGASEEQLGGQQRSELHVEPRTRGGQISHVGLGLLVDTLGVDAGNVAAPGVPVGKARYVRSKGTMREASLTVGGLRDVARKSALAVAWAGLADGTWVMVLHPEKMRGDQVVPTDVR